MQTWKQTFRAVDGTVLSGAAVSVYLAGTTTAARVFDINDTLYDTAPQLTTDAAGFIEFSFDEDDFSTGQLFDVKVTCNFLCNDLEDVDLRSIKLLQDTEGGLEFKKTFIQSEAPTDSTLHDGDLWFDTDDSKSYVYTDGAWAEVSGAAGPPGEDGVDAGNWSSTLEFESTDYRTVRWSVSSNETIITAGTTYTITAGNTGSMTAATTYYIYLSPGDSTTVLQTTTTAATAVGTGRILVGVAYPSVSPIYAQFQAFGGKGGVFLGADSIAAGSITADEIASNTITTSELVFSPYVIGTNTYSDVTGGPPADADATTAANINTALTSTLLSFGSSGKVTFGSTNHFISGDSTSITLQSSSTSYLRLHNTTGINLRTSYPIGIIGSTVEVSGTTSAKLIGSSNQLYLTASAATLNRKITVTPATTSHDAITGTSTSGVGVQGNTATGNGLKGVASSSGIGSYGYSSSGQGVSGYSVSNYGVYGATGGTYGLYTPDYAYTVNGVVPFTGTHIGFSKQKLVIGDIANSEGSLLLGISEGMPFLGTTTKANDKAIAGIISRVAKNTDILASEELGGIVDDTRFFDKKVINERTIIAEEDDPDSGVKKGDVSVVNDGYNYKMKPASGGIVAKETHPTTLQGVIESDKYYVTFINALGEGGINVCKEGGNIEIGDYICSSSIPGKGMKQSDDLLHNYTVAKSLVNVTWKASETDIRMIACTYHCG